MKEYNPILGALFSGKGGEGGYNAGFRQSRLAALYQNDDPEKQALAAKQLAYVDPESASKWQQEQAALRQEGLKRKATMIANAPPAQRGQLYSAVLPDIRKDWAEAPEQYTPELDQMVTAWAQSVGGNSQNTGVQSTFISGGKLNYLTRDGRAVDTGKAVDDTYKEIIDPVTGQISGYAKRGNYLAPTGTSAMPQVQAGADPMAGGLDRINQGVQVLKANGVPVEKINEWADNEFAKLQGSVQQGVVEQAPAQAPTSQARVAVKPKEEKIETWGAPTAVTKNGKPAMIQISNLGNERERPDLAPADSTKAPTVDASNAAGFYRRMAQSEQIIGQLEQQGYSPASNKGDYFTAGGTMTNWATSPKGQQYYNAATNWIRANLRKESGAAIGVDEAKQEFSTYFPIPGDTKETIEQKRQLRQQTAESVKGAGLPAMKYQDQSGGKSQANGFDPLGILK